MSSGETVRAEGIVTPIGGNSVLFLSHCKVDVLRRAPVVGDIVKFRYQDGLARIARHDLNGLTAKDGRELPSIRLLQWPTEEEVREFKKAESMAMLAEFDDEQLAAELLRRHQEKKKQKDAGEK